VILPDVLAALDELSLPALAAVQAKVSARLVAIATEAQPGADQQLDARQAAALMGISTSKLHKSWREFPFAFKIGNKLLFSRCGITEWIRMRHQA
jgi:predicted DNA-binding transcriptional regulator AlpA